MLTFSHHFLDWKWEKNQCHCVINADKFDIPYKNIERFAIHGKKSTVIFNRLLSSDAKSWCPVNGKYGILFHSTNYPNVLIWLIDDE